MGIYIIKRQTNQEYYFIFQADNGRAICISESYVSKQGCWKGIDSVKTNCINDFRYDRVDQNRDYRFNLRAVNSEIIFRSSEGYVDIRDRESAISLLKKEGGASKVEDRS